MPSVCENARGYQAKKKKSQLMSRTAFLPHCRWSRFLSSSIKLGTVVAPETPQSTCPWDCGQGGHTLGGAICAYDCHSVWVSPSICQHSPGLMLELLLPLAHNLPNSNSIFMLQLSFLYFLCNSWLHENCAKDLCPFLFEVSHG